MPDYADPDRNEISDDTPNVPVMGVRHWRCPNCGQHTFTTLRDQPPDKCDFCADLTTWEFIGSTLQVDD